MITPGDLGLAGEAAMLMAEDVERDGHPREASLLEAVALVTLGFTVAGFLRTVAQVAGRRGFRRGTDYGRQFGPAGFPGHVVTGAYLGAWREAATFYGTAPEEPMPLPEHIAAAAAQYESERGPAAAEPPGGWFGISVAPAGDG